DGRMLVTDSNGRNLYQFLPDGSPDPGFGAEGIVNNSLFTAAKFLPRATGGWLLARGRDILEVDALGNPGRLFSSLANGFTATGFAEIPGGGYVIGGRRAAAAGPGATQTPVVARFQPGDEPGSL